MTHDPSNPFGEFEQEFKDIKKEAPGGKVPDGTYKFVLTTQDPTLQRHFSELAGKEIQITIVSAGK